MENVLSCFFPTTVVLVDDDQDVLCKLEKLLEKTNVTCKSFTNPTEALNYISHVNYNKLNCYNMMKNGEQDTSECKSLFFNTCEIHKEIYNSQRFLKISVLISDYYMPEMNGPELCQALSNQNIRRILLTDKAEDSQAIDEFSNNNITDFVRKDTENFDNKILERVNEAVHQHFNLYTKQVKLLLIDEGDHLVDPIFSSEFFSLLHNRFIEYYMIDAFGGYLVFDSDGRAGILSFTTEAEVDKLVEIAVDNKADKEVIEQLQSRKYVLVSHSRVGKLPPVEEWKNHLRPAQQCSGARRNYYYFIDEHGKDIKLDVDFDKVVSYNQFKNSQYRYDPTQQTPLHY